ncbi:hypothetical protein O3W44_01580 [Pantoea sp. LMR881]|uniref:hypothetical protein n=1 Tax=Pantoea sp. LMR881 TaxID=3014336 RepID=UPI0022AFC01D|nr:hypothetical protein [Pantoea sp. LMR881]MCZ4057816.1 hypothetical protein [Pantoea sp. LMR881]MCZ4058060.1 hypothetical protein [Pantoea sp. LMR881]
MNKLTADKCHELFVEFATHRYGEEWMKKDEEIEGNYAVECVNDEWDAWQEAWRLRGLLEQEQPTNQNGEQ